MNFNFRKYLCSRVWLGPLMLVSVFLCGCFNFGSAPVDIGITEEIPVEILVDVEAEESIDESGDEEMDQHTGDVDDTEAEADPDIQDIPVEVPIDVIEETEIPPACPPDDPPSHVYVNVSGIVQTGMGGDPSGLFVGVYGAMELFSSPNPDPLDWDTVAGDDSFDFECVDVGPLSIGIVGIVDDMAVSGPDGPSGEYFPTGVELANWYDSGVKEDVTGAVLFVIENMAVDMLLEFISTLDPVGEGFVMGVVKDEATSTPLESATVNADGSGDTVDVYYLGEDGYGLETDGNTSSSGLFVIPDPLGFTMITASKSGYTFESKMAATRGGYCFFILINGRG